MNSLAYKTYLIRWSDTAGYWIEKGGAFIGWATTKDNAKQLIDELTA